MYDKIVTEACRRDAAAKSRIAKREGVERGKARPRVCDCCGRAPSRVFYAGVAVCVRCAGMMDAA